MIVFLRWAFGFVFVVMVSVAIWASLRSAIWEIPANVSSHPWFIATLFDTYFAFLTFYAWVVYKETGWAARVGWLLAILVLGNIAMAGYMLIQLFRLPTTASAEDLLLRRKA
jgi:hypothetical protein